MKFNKKILIAAVAALLVIIGVITAFAYDGSVNQGADHSAETGMYLYTVDISLYNPCNSADMDKDAVCELWFDFDYTDANGYGKASTYRLDMSWKNGRNLNSEILKKNFIRGNDNACKTQLSVWIPGLVKKVKVHLNMDGGERLGFTVEGISLNGYRVNTGVDYVSSAYYDSDAEIPCRVPKAALNCAPSELSAEAAPRDQYNGIFTQGNISAAQAEIAQGNYDRFYHYGK